MNYDEFAFFNQQLAAMLKDGLPLEGALRQLSAGMRSGPLKAEVQLLESDLARGAPLKEALEKRDLPDFYRRMVSIGVAGNDLPGMLTLIADHYSRANALWTRLKGLLVYPVLVLLVMLGLTFLLSMAFHKLQENLFNQFPGPGLLATTVWFPPALLLIAVLLCAAALGVPKWRARLRWWLPGFRETSLAQLASAMAMMLRNGTPMPEALALAETLESGGPARPALARWRELLASGKGKPELWPMVAAPLPPLFLWLVQQGGENPAAGFQKAAELYERRAGYKIELALYGALPVSILFLGQLVLWQVVPMLRTLTLFLNMIGDTGGS